MLPRLDGYEVCRQIRQTSTVPIVMLTARGDTMDVVVGLEAGADDYVRKPFDLPELIARVRAALRRAGAGADEDARAPSRAARRSTSPAGPSPATATDIPLTRTEFDLLLELVRHAGQVLSRDVLLDRVWGYDYLGDSRLVDVAIQRLRSKVEADPGGARADPDRPRRRLQGRPLTRPDGGPMIRGVRARLTATIVVPRRPDRDRPRGRRLRLRRRPAPPAGPRRRPRPGPLRPVGPRAEPPRQPADRGPDRGPRDRLPVPRPADDHRPGRRRAVCLDRAARAASSRRSRTRSATFVDRRPDRVLVADASTAARRLVIGGRSGGTGPEIYFFHDVAADRAGPRPAPPRPGRRRASSWPSSRVVAARVVARGVLAPVDEASRAAERIARGDLSARVPVTSTDEFGAVGRPVQPDGRLARGHDRPARGRPDPEPAVRRRCRPRAADAGRRPRRRGVAPRRPPRCPAARRPPDRRARRPRHRPAAGSSSRT